jgi:hypothetical protein
MLASVARPPVLEARVCAVAAVDGRVGVLVVEISVMMEIIDAVCAELRFVWDAEEFHPDTSPQFIESIKVI